MELLFVGCSEKCGRLNKYTRLNETPQIRRSWLLCETRALLSQIRLRGFINKTMQMSFCVNLPFKADGCKQRAEEDPGIRVAFSGKERQPTGTLLSSLSWSFMSQQVGHPHGIITDVLAQGHVWWDREAARGTPGFPKSSFPPRKHGPDSWSGVRVPPPLITVLLRMQLFLDPRFILTLTLNSVLHFCL